MIKVKSLIAQVDSENIKRLKFTPSQETMIVEFTNGGFYQYKNIDALLFQHLISANSIGGTFAKDIRSFPSKYPCQKLDINKIDD